MIIKPRFTVCAAALMLILTTESPLANEVPDESVLVTASRVAEDGSTVPLAWTALAQSDIDTVAAIHINEILQRVPGAWVSRGNGQESLISLRSPVLTGAGSCGTFFTASDGIGLRAPGFCNVNQLFDANFEQAARIEVIKGPATALYGSNAMHGVINIISAAPSTVLEQNIALEAGPDDYYRLKYDYSDTQGAHGVRVSVNGTSDGGFKDDAGYDQQKATLRHDYTGSQWNLRSVLDVSNLNQETAGFIQGFKSYKDSAERDSNPNPEAYRDAKSLRLYTQASTQLNEQSTLIITPYLRDNQMEFLQHFLPWQPVEDNAHSSVGIRGAVHTETDSVYWITGIDTEYTDATLSEFQAEPFSPNQPAGLHYDYQVDASVAALYSQIRTTAAAPWTLNAGARYEYTRYDYDNRTADGAPCEPGASACRFFAPADREDNFSDWSVNVGLSYDLHDDHLTYVRLARGFRAPQATELYRLQAGQRSADLDSEQIDNIEFGFRGVIAGTAKYDLALYYMEKDNVIFQSADRQNISGASTEHYGAELSLDYAFAKNWLLSVDANFARHRYRSDFELIGSSGNIDGNEIDTAPKVFGSARLLRDLSEISGRSNSYAELEWVYLDEYYLEPDNEHSYDGHSLLNLRVASQVHGGLHAALRLTNLLDKQYAERADFGFGQYRYFVGQPRAAYLEIRYKLN